MQVAPKKLFHFALASKRISSSFAVRNFAHLRHCHVRQARFDVDFSRRHAFMLEQALDIPLREFGAACVRRALASGVVQADFLHVGLDHAGNARVGVLFRRLGGRKWVTWLSSRGACPIASPGRPRGRCLPIYRSCTCELVARAPRCLVLNLLDSGDVCIERLSIVHCWCRVRLNSNKNLAFGKSVQIPLRCKFIL